VNSTILPGERSPSMMSDRSSVPDTMNVASPGTSFYPITNQSNILNEDTNQYSNEIVRR